MPQHQTIEPAADTDHSDIGLPDNDIGEVCRWVTSKCRRDAGEALRHGMETVEILKDLGMDQQGLLVGLLQPLWPFDEKEQALIANRFGALTLTLLHRAAQLRQLSALSQGGRTERSSTLPAHQLNDFARPEGNEENLRKMLIAMIDDIRVVLIELARHLSILRRSKEAARAVQQSIGRSTLEVYAPLANRLGVWQLKWQMEDCALRCLEPEAYRNLAATLDEKRVAREEYVGEFIRLVRRALEDSAVAGEVRGRPKHLYGIWKKMRRKGLAFENLMDIQAVRIVVDSVADCYAALAAVHTNWPPLPGEFDDYIATPKENGYRSIHSVITGPQGKTIEVQIRTAEMHRQSELGVAAHWRYKENIRPDESIDNKVLRLRQLLEWKQELRDSGALADSFTAADGQERVYVFSPKGTVIDLPAGSTPIDFAYAIHTEVGHRTRGARVNGKMAPLGHRLESGEQVQIQTVKHGHPSRDWLRSDLGYVRTRRARARIAQWFKHAEYDQHLADGRAMLERELTRLGMEDLGYDKIARKTHFHKTDDMLAAIGANDFKLSRALAPFRPALDGADTLPAKPRRRPKHPGNFSVSGVGNVLTRMANCCNPIPGDSIVGFITSGRGVSIHRRNCANLKNLDAQHRSRLVEVQWGESDLAAYPVEIHLVACHRSGLLNEITQLLKDDKIEVLKLNMETDEEQNAYIQLRLEISDLKKLSRIQNRLSQVPDVLRVRRVTS